MLDFTTYREPLPLISFKDLLAVSNDVLLYDYTVSTATTKKRGILCVTPHISLAAPGPLTYRDALEYDCRELTHMTPKPWQGDIPVELLKGSDIVLQAMCGAGKSLLYPYLSTQTAL